MRQGTVTFVWRSTLVTTAPDVSANAVSVSPLLVFNRKNFKYQFLSNALQGSSGSANKFGLMTGRDFQGFMIPSIKKTRVTKERLVLLLLDNHQSLLDLPKLDLFEGNGVTLLSFYIIYF
ncbi:hypothetical protein AVEN_9089-1 [Araneus ventricosus]|uniref:DDE-1 domain-containing protein n=1 Tax=Araneus ventricosus TaxID=182803 RepID=A0A4Y1ZME5_ARAVE|nr:hypothetical protein AVEN_189751-1 [Araneus ventricosus]GBL58679.1 hypothetical protein AVEN_9089-1 [Araneus ventricosus]